MADMSADAASGVHCPSRRAHLRDSRSASRRCSGSSVRGGCATVCPASPRSLLPPSEQSVAFRRHSLHGPTPALESATGGSLMDGRTHTPHVSVPAQPTAAAVEVQDDTELVRRLREGDEAAFSDIVDRWSRTMLRVARAHVSTEASSQEVVQDTWLAVVKGLSSFEGRSSLKTWVFRILVNTAKTRGVREARTLPMSSVIVLDDDGPTVDPSRFRGADDMYAHNWTPSGLPQRWEGDPAREVLRGEVRELVTSALDTLPERQRVVVLLRDVQGCDSDEVCDILRLTPENQRVLLHRGRARVRAELEDYYRRSGP